VRPVIMLDPGHGGNDPGAVASNGRQEDDAALEMALTAKHFLVMNGWDARLTRDGHEKAKVDLHKRVWMAHEANAKALISVHYNCENCGAAIYYAPGWASLRLARTFGGLLRLSDDRLWETAHSRFKGLYVDAFRDDRPAILWECASINAAPPAGARGKELRKSLALKLVKAVEYLR
jgi:N-acetylmuramoyl-L-alanine amidase